MVEETTKSDEELAREQWHANQSRDKYASLGIPASSCVLCDDAMVTVAYAPGGRVRLCAKHNEEYLVEGRKGLPSQERTFWWRMDVAREKLGQDGI